MPKPSDLPPEQKSANLVAAVLAGEPKSGPILADVLLTSMTEGVSLSAEDGTIVYTNPAEDRMFGYEAGELVGLHVSVQNAYPPEENERLVSLVIAELKQSGSWRGEWSNRRKDGTVFTTRSRINTVQIEGRSHWLCVQEDVTDETRVITALRQSEEELRRSETRLRLAIEAGQIGEWELDVEADTSVRASRHDQIFGYDEPVQDWGFETMIAHVLPEDRKRVEAAYRTAAETATGWHFECRIQRANDGEVRWIAAHSKSQLDDGGRVVRMFGLVQDITEQREAEQRLHELNQKLAAQITERTAERDRIWVHSNDLMGVFGFDGRRRAINPAWSRILGFDEETLLKTPFNEITHPDDRESLTLAVQRLAKGEKIVSFEDRLRDKEGNYHVISWTGVPAGDLFYAIGRDVTEQRQAEDGLRQAQKMEAVGQLTGGVAHDFNNLLTPIIGGLDMLQRRGLGGERERRLIDGALQSAERAKTLIQRLLAFARRQPLQPTAVDLAELVAGMAELITRTVGPQIKVAVNAAADLPPARADANQVEMALLNLSVNARDAMPDGGQLTISAEAETIDAAHRSNLTPGRYIRLSVTDNGVGMDDATLRRAIEPFFSTKGIGKGTGLGLSMVHGLASQLGGSFAISSRPGLGTSAELWLPISKGLESSNEQKAGSAMLSAEQGTALLVDDEDVVRESTAEMLSELGYEVVEARSAEEALKLISKGCRINLLVADHLMPGMTGTDLAREIRSWQPSLPVLLVSGYADVEGIAPDLPRLAKPFRRADLADSLARLGSAPNK